MSQSTILYEKQNAVAIVTLNRPDKLNSFNEKMHQALALTLDMIDEDDSVRCLLITGSGRGFCAGQDLGDRNVSPGAKKVDLGETIGKYYNPLIKRLHKSKIPTVCAVNGVAAGAGVNIALACDIVIAADTAKFVEVFSNIGLLPDSGGTYHLPRHVGLARALGLSLLAAPLKAEKAKDWGLIWDVCAPGDLMDEALQLAENLASKPPVGMALNRAAIRASFNNTINKQLELERLSMQKAGFTDDYAEAVSAFMEKRKPTFTGK
ncbi:MAG: 2-(1,2-epoxy-1,2-dihydrophenyl)acetyl-CoA isomerase PaaG [Robiginitomaculum sp.]|nr:2-(1,2-epoxy-1,2-dihydrophenyl)acetyl-CoA isomerase PaaG [Robiginitomaculum sp.]